MPKIRRPVPSAITELLGSVSLFAGLPKRKLQIVADMLREHTFAPGDAIVTEGDSSGRFYLIVEGGARVQVRGHTVNVLGPGQYFGEFAVIDQAPRSATVVATTPVTAYSLASISLRPLLKEEPEITYRLLLNACQRLRALESSLSSRRADASGCSPKGLLRERSAPSRERRRALRAAPCVFAGTDGGLAG